MEDFMYIHFSNSDEFKEWLEVYGETEKGVWVLMYKKHTGITNISHNDAADAATCYGWVEVIVKRVDADKFAVKFTPRRKSNSHWSISTKKRVLRLIESGEMTERGLKTIDEYKKTGKLSWTIESIENDEKKRYTIHPEFKSQLKENKEANYYFKKLTEKQRSYFIGWINQAKREETKLKRIDKAIALLEDNKRFW